MATSIALNFEDGVTRFIDARPGETVADAAYRKAINIPLDCRDGACGTCKCRVQSGDYDGGSYIEDALTDEEAASGLALACQMVAKSDLVLDILASSDVCKTRGATFTAAIRSVTRLSPTTFDLTLDGAGPVAFLPGQYASVAVPGTQQRRSYSFSSPPGADTLSFLVRDLHPGAMSTFLRDTAAPGMALEFTGPSGTFYLREIKRPLLLLAGGTGLAPFLAMLAKLGNTHQPVHLVYGVTNDDDLVCLDQLAAFAEREPAFTYTTCVASEASTHPRRGYVMAHIEPTHLNGGNVDIYLCGPPPMVDAVRTWLTSQGITPANLYYEKFSPSGIVGETQRAAA